MSTSSAPKMGRHEMDTLIIERAWKDPSFKKEFTTDPKGTIEKYSGQKLPQELVIQVHEEDAHTMHLTLPAPPPNMAELSDEDLERVAGGTEFVIGAAIISVISAVAAASISVANDQTRSRAGW
jgi:hypothetical protein